MVLRITKQQEAQIRRLAKLRCANFVEGNCLLLDGLEECTCVQLLCKSGIYCHYFLKAVLPQEKTLSTQIKNQNNS